MLEPMAQIFARPDEGYATTLGIPNEDAQSLVFDASSLFDRDKFSGYDRIEGGTRANLGVRYTGTFSKRLDGTTACSANPTNWAARIPSPRLTW